MANRAMNRHNSSIFGLFLITLNDIYTLSSVSLIPLLRDPSDLSHELATTNLAIVEMGRWFSAQYFWILSWNSAGTDAPILMSALGLG